MYNQDNGLGVTPKQLQPLKLQAEKDPNIGLISRVELVACCHKHLNASKYAKGLAAILGPKWESLKRDVK